MPQCRSTRPFTWRGAWIYLLAAGLFSGSGSWEAFGADSAKGKKEAPKQFVPDSVAKRWNKKLPVPLTRSTITFRKAEKVEEGEPVGEDRFVNVDLKGDPKDTAEPARIVVNLARRSDRFVGVRIWLKSNADDFLDKLNANRQQLIDLTSGILGNKGLSEIETSGFRTFFGAELMSAFNKAFGANIVKEVIVEGPFVQ